MRNINCLFSWVYTGLLAAILLILACCFLRSIPMLIACFKMVCSSLLRASFSAHKIVQRIPERQKAKTGPAACCKACAKLSASPSVTLLDRTGWLIKTKWCLAASASNSLANGCPSTSPSGRLLMTVRKPSLAMLSICTGYICRDTDKNAETDLISTQKPLKY